MYVSKGRRSRTRRRQPWWTFLFLFGLGAPAVAAAAESPKAATAAHSDAAEDAGPELVIAGDRPTRGEAHADCNFRMPLYVHTVQGGEHLGIIGGHYGVRPAELVALNPQLENPDLIRPGDEIRVCPEIFPRLTNTVKHEVAAGETLGAIAGMHGISLQELLEQQEGRIEDPNQVRVGQTLTLKVDGGLAPDFLPPLPAAKPRKRSGGKRSPVNVALKPGPHITIKRPRSAFGTPKTVRLFERAVANYRKRSGGAPKILVGDLSRKGGGKFAPHVSHRTGRDIDLGYVVKGGHGSRTRFGGVTPETLDVARTWTLINSMIDTGEVVYVFVDYRIQQQLYDYAKKIGVSQRKLDELFQYPRGRRTARGVIRHWPSHRHHFHVRFRS